MPQKPNGCWEAVEAAGIFTVIWKTWSIPPNLSKHTKALKTAHSAGSSGPNPERPSRAHSDGFGISNRQAVGVSSIWVVIAWRSPGPLSARILNPWKSCAGRIPRSKPIDAEDHAIGLVKYENGAIGQFEVSWTFRGGLDLRDEVMGTEGTIWVNNFLRTGLEMFTTEKGRLCGGKGRK